MRPETPLKVLAGLEMREGSSCWWWPGSPNTNGYGQISEGTGKVSVRYHTHRVLYEWFAGPQPRENVLHHTCFNKVCANPEHIISCTRGEHAAIHQALYREANPTCKMCGGDSWAYRDGGKHRKCRACLLRRSRKYEAKKRGKLDGRSSDRPR